MKKKLGLLLVAFFILLPIINVRAEEPVINLSINGPESASVNEKIDYTISINSSKQATKFETTVKYDTSVLELTSILKKDNWTGINSVKNTGNNTITFSNQGVTGQTTVVILRFKVKSADKSDTTLSLDNTKVTLSSDDSDTVVTIESNKNTKKQINIKSDDNTLKTLKIDDKKVNGFSPAVYNYTLEVDALTDKVKVDATLNNSEKAKFVDKYGPRSVSLNYGSNEVLIKTKSESEKEATYKITIVRKDDRVSNTDLKSLIINGGDIKFDFDKSVLSYTINTFKLDTIEIEAIADDSNAKVSVDVPSKLIIGDNKAKVTVTSVTGEVKTYELLIVNSEVPTDTRLKNLSIKGISLGFNSDTYKYSVRYDKSYRNGVKLYYTPVSDSVEIIVKGNQNIKTKDKITVLVKALDGSNSSEYTITFVKDTRINFFFIVDIVVGTIVVIFIMIELKKRKKIKQQKLEKAKEEELEKTKELDL